ncbi:MAG: prepilin-type N-terminal cleavage/methylation domain-containing protein [Patescibacteria group bacterium]
MRRHSSGFTLIELLVVIAIIGLLATIITASLGSARQKSRDARRVADIKTIQVALENYYNDNLMFPKSIYPTSGVVPNNGLSPNYLSVVPTDPGGSVTPAQCATNAALAGCYAYQAYAYSGSPACSMNNAPVKYHLGAALEQTTNSALTQDVDAPVAGSGVMTGFTPCNGGGSGDFSGLSVSVSPAQCNSNAGSAQPGGTESCYEVTN